MHADSREGYWYLWSEKAIRAESQLMNSTHTIAISLLRSFTPMDRGAEFDQRMYWSFLFFFLSWLIRKLLAPEQHFHFVVFRKSEKEALEPTSAERARISRCPPPPFFILNAMEYRIFSIYKLSVFGTMVRLKYVDLMSFVRKRVIGA